jgi:hypothetical protein
MNTSKILMRLVSFIVHRAFLPLCQIDELGKSIVVKLGLSNKEQAVNGQFEKMLFRQPNRMLKTVNTALM